MGGGGGIMQQIIPQLTQAGPQQPMQAQPTQPQIQPGYPQAYGNPFINAMANQIDPQMMQRISTPQQPGFGGNQVYAGGTPNFDERTGTYINPQRPPVIQPGPGVFPQPQPQDSKRGGFRDMLINRFQQPQDPQQRGLGGLQLDKFRSRIR